MKPNGRQTITRGSLARNIWHLTWPSAISQVLFLLPNLYDTIWLGRLGREAQAAAGLVISVRITMISVLMGLSLASGAVVARYLGAGDQEKANLAVLQAVIIMIAASGSIGALGLAFVRPLLALAGADWIILPLAVRYARIIFGGLIAVEMVPSVGYMMAGAGAPKIMLGMTLLSTATLVAAEPLLVGWLGLEGAAVALVASNVVGMLYGLARLVTGRAPARLDLRHARLDLPMMTRILRIAMPAVLQRGAPNLAMSVLTRLISSYGASTLAAWVIAKRIADFSLIPGMAMARALAAMVGQNLGAAKPERAARSVRLVARTVAVAAGLILGLLALFAPRVVAFFTLDAETVVAGARAIRTLAVGYLAFALSTVFESTQSGAGDTVSPTVINLLSLWAFQVPVAILFARVLGLGAHGIWFALALGWILQATLMGLRVHQGRWKLKRI
jgi:putative MATE family efflux protein